MRLPRPNVLLVAAIAAFLLLGLGLFSASGNDDSHITYWAAYALRTYGRIVNYNGDRVEQSSSLAHVVLLALLGLVTRAPIPTLGPLSSLAGGVVAIVLVARLGRAVAPASPRGAEIVLGTAACFVYWSVSGLESTLAAAAATWVVLECAAHLEAPSARRLARCGAAMLIYLAMRPESSYVLACALLVTIAYSVYHRRRAAGRIRASHLRAELALAGTALALSLAIFGFRYVYFGAFFPNPVYSKAVGMHAGPGLAYVGASLYPATLWLVPGFLAGLYHVVKDAAVNHEPRFASVLAAAFGVAYLGFIILTGGDWMAGGRFLVLGLPLLVAVTLVGLTKTLRSARRIGVALAVIVCMNVLGVFGLAHNGSAGRPIWSTFALRGKLDARIGDRGYTWFELANKAHLRDTTVAAATLDVMAAIDRKRPGTQFFIMSSYAGMTAYHVFAERYGSARFIDTSSLVTRDFVRCLPRSYLHWARIGLTLSYPRYFQDREDIDRRCGIRRPDIVFDQGRKGYEELLQENGYTIVYRQHGPIRTVGFGAEWLHAGTGSDMFVAVDTALLEGTGIGEGKPWVWDIY